MSIIRNIVHKKTITKNAKPKALCFFYDGKFDAELADLGIELIGCKQFSIHDWYCRAKHENITLIQPNEIPNFNYDFVIFNDLTKHRDHILNVPGQLHIPGIIIQHEPNSETKYHLNQRLQEAKLNCISTEYQSPNGIPYGVKQTTVENKDIEILTDLNFDKDNHQLTHTLKQQIPNIKIIGQNSELIKEQIDSYKEYREYFNRCKIYLYFPRQRNISYEVLWVLASGGTVITFSSDNLQKLGSKNIIYCNSVPNMIQTAIHHKKMATKENLEEKLPYDDFKDNWTKIIQQYNDKVYTYG